jgi:hypothetical protein
MAGWGARRSACGGLGRVELRLRRAGARGGQPPAAGWGVLSFACVAGRGAVGVFSLSAFWRSPLDSLHLTKNLHTWTSFSSKIR